MEIDTSVAQILEEAVEGQEIILETEGESQDGEIEEVVEIIEEVIEVDDDGNEIEHIEQVEQVEQIEQVEQVEQVEHVEQVEVEEFEQVEEQEQVEVEENIVQRTNGVYMQEDSVYDKKRVIYATSLSSTGNQERSHSQIHYDASADWEDEEYEQEEQNNIVQNVAEEQTTNIEEFNTYATYNNEENTETIDGSEEADNSRTHMNFEHTVNAENDMERDDSQQEIIQNSENNLVYTVLGSKKQTRSISENKSNVEFVELQRYKDDNLPEDGTIYYAVNNDDGTYIQTVEDEQQYQYVSEEPMEQANQEWEDSNQNAESQQEQSEQEQIFLHEDEDGQLYFKNEHGQLQPVYLTPDGNYAIAENSSDEQESQEDIQQVQQEQVETENYVLPDLDVKQFHSKKRVNDRSQDIDNDDSTVTISLIISEDENGQKRTQVIIPTPAESKCNICNKTFKTSLQLLKHNRLKHAREEDITTRNFPCDLCPKRFSDQNSLARHRKTHSESRVFQCLECHKCFPTSNGLRKHLSMHHLNCHPPPCIYCGRRFQDKVTLAKHEQSHLAGEKKPHVCDICQKCFSNPTDLNIHKKNHDPDRKFDCEVCGREFNRLNNLQRHMMVHQQQSANEEILSCNVCGITYKFSSSLTRHMVTTHMNPEKLRQQAEEQRRKRENNYRRYLENRKTYETQQPKRAYRRSTSRLMDDEDEEEAD